MFSRVRSAAVLGIRAYIVEVETDLDYKLPSFKVVGLPEGAVRESRERVTSAVKNSGHVLPQRSVTVNLAPADIRKEGAAFDLPIAVGILAADGVIPPESLEGVVLVGELALDGSLRSVPGILPITLAVRDAGLRRIMLPPGNAGEAALIEGMKVYPVATLADAVGALTGRKPIAPRPVEDIGARLAGFDGDADFADVKGQNHVKRALEVAAAGGHNIIMVGPPGSGKTMLARRMPSILPSMSVAEALETTAVYSVAGALKNGSNLVIGRPFRSPHHTISDAALIGGGSSPRPGEVSLAHNGVLFIDEIPELGKSAIEALRQPLEDGTVHVSRAAYAVEYPARFMLVAAMNPCPCGYLTDPSHECISVPSPCRGTWPGYRGPSWTGLTSTSMFPR